MTNLVAPFVIQQIKNDTKIDLKLFINPLGQSLRKSQELHIPAHQTVSCNLPFGREEEKGKVPPSGYVFTNMVGDMPFKTIRIQFELVEDPLLEIDIVHEYRFKIMPYLYHWSLCCDDKKVGTFTGVEHKRIKYMLVIGDQCRCTVVVL